MGTNNPTASLYRTVLLIIMVKVITIDAIAWRNAEPFNCTEKLFPPAADTRTRLAILKNYLWSRNPLGLDTNSCFQCTNCKTNNFKQLVKAIRNKELRVAVQKNIPPYVIFMNQGHSAQLTGYMGELWKMVEEAYDFRSVYQLMNYSQGCEILASGKADIMLSPVAITTSELDKFHFALTYTSSYYQLYVKNQGARANSRFYLYTWDSGLWCAFLLTLIIMTIFFWLISIFRKNNDMESVGLVSQSLHELAADLKVNLDPRATSLSISNSFFCVLGAVTLQGVCMRPTAFSMRVATVVSLLFGFLMYTAFSAVLVSRLAVIREDSPISDLQDLLKTRKYSLCLRKNSNSYSLFKDSDGRLKAEWEGLLNASPCHMDAIESSQVIESLCKDNTVIMESNNIMNHHLATFTNCSIIEVSSKYSTASISILVRKDLPYAGIISKYILKIYNSGLISLLKVRWGVKKQDPSSQGDLGVTLDHLINIFLLYFCTIIISVVILFFEIIAFKMERKHRRKAKARKMIRGGHHRQSIPIKFID